MRKDEAMNWTRRQPSHCFKPTALLLRTYCQQPKSNQNIEWEKNCKYYCQQAYKSTYHHHLPYFIFVMNDICNCVSRPCIAFIYSLLIVIAFRREHNVPDPSDVRLAVHHFNYWLAIGGKEWANCYFMMSSSLLYCYNLSTV